MDKPLEFWSDSNQFGMRIFEPEIDLLLQLCKQSGSVETGGILIGTYSPALDCAVVSEVTPPPPDSRRGRYWFIRGIKGLKSKLKFLWNKKQKFYLGEWHFHPGGVPQPSCRDIDGMRGISESPKYKCPEPILLIVGGSFPDDWQIRVFAFQRKKAFLELHRLNP